MAQDALYYLYPYGYSERQTLRERFGSTIVYCATMDVSTRVTETYHENCFSQSRTCTELVACDVSLWLQPTRRTSWKLVSN